MSFLRAAPGDHFGIAASAATIASTPDFVQPERGAGIKKKNPRSLPSAPRGRKDVDDDAGSLGEADDTVKRFFGDAVSASHSQQMPVTFVRNCHA